MFGISKPFLETEGHCPACDRDVRFVSRNDWLRDNFVCTNCGSIPRERAIMTVIESFFPTWRDAVIHESSSVNRGASARIARECPGYTGSQYFPESEPGSMVGNMRCENLESLTFENESIDLHITQDVMEHVFHPSKAFSEIARTLKPGGMHIFTVPLVKKARPSSVRARIENGKVIHLLEEQYHGNPVGDGRSLVTMDWGFDICRHIHEACGLFTHIIHIDDLEKGIRAEYIEVLVTVKPHAGQDSISMP